MLVCCRKWEDLRDEDGTTIKASERGEQREERDTSYRACKFF